MRGDIRRFDAAEGMDSAEEIAAFVDAALAEAAETGDAALLPHALGVVARARGMSEIARETGLSRESLYKALSEDGNPSFATVLKVLQALSVQLRATTPDNPEAA